MNWLPVRKRLVGVEDPILKIHLHKLLRVCFICLWFAMCLVTTYKELHLVEY